MKVGISGPILIEPFRKYLETTTAPADDLGVKGLGGTAVNTLAQCLLEHGYDYEMIRCDKGQPGKSGRIPVSEVVRLVGRKA